MDNMIIGVTGINAVDNPGPGVGVARSLKESGELNVKIAGLAYDAMDPGIYMDWLIDKSFQLPYPSGGQDAYINRLLYIKQNYGLDAIISNLDVELPLFINAGAQLEQAGIKIMVPTREQFKLRGKDRLTELADMIGIKAPQAEVVTSYDELDKAVESIGLPVMIKGAYYKAHRANSKEEAVSYFNKIVAEWGYPIIVQQVVKGDELNVVGVGDGSGAHLGLVAIKKMWVTAIGKIWNGVTIKHDAMLQAAGQFVEATKWRGGFELECMVDGDTVYLIEINPRLPAWSWFATAVGINLPLNMIKHMNGEMVQPDLDYPAGKMFIRYTYELVTDMQPFQNISTRGES